MFRKTVSSVVLVLLVMSMLTLAFNIGLVRAQPETVYINSDGSITPSGAPIVTSDGITYAFTGSISYPTYEGVVIERSSIVIDGKGYTVQGDNNFNGTTGLYVGYESNVIIENTKIAGFSSGILLGDSSNNTIIENTATSNYEGIGVIDSSKGNTISGNTVTANSGQGIAITELSNDNTVSENTVTANGWGIYVSSSNNIVSGNTVTANSGPGIYLSSYSPLIFQSSNNIVSGNTVAENSGIGIYLVASSNNIVSGNTVTAQSGYPTIVFAIASSNNAVYHNNFVGGIAIMDSTYGSVTNTWDDGYPSGGNYWSDYATEYPNAAEIDGSGLWNTPYVIDVNNTDNYPLISPYGSSTYVVWINAHCNTEELNVAVPITEDGSATGYTTPQRFIGLSGTHTFTVANADPNGHAFLQWSTGETFTTITISSAGTYIAYYQASPSPTQSSTSLVCNPNPASVGSPVTCTATVNGSNPTGTVTWNTSSSTGSFSSPTFPLSSGGCSTTYTDTNPGTVTITASYSGDIYNMLSSGNATLVISTALSFNLTINTTIGGTTNPATGTYTRLRPYSSIQVVANPDINYFLHHWELDGSNVSSANAYNVTMDQNHTLTAVFTPISPLSTEVGENVIVSIPNGVSLTFSNVTSAGATTVNETTYEPAKPSGFLLATNSLFYYDVETTANYTGNITISIAYNPAGMTPQQESSLALMHWDETLAQWVNITTYVDTVNNVIYGEASSLSPFAIMLKTVPGDINSDFHVSLADLVLLANAYGSHFGDTRWNPNADIDGNGVVGLTDLVLLANHYGQHYP